MKTRVKSLFLCIVSALTLACVGGGDLFPSKIPLSQADSPQSENLIVPPDQKYSVLNHNVPHFSNEEITRTEPFEKYGPLDKLGRVSAANAILGVELMPSKERGDISKVKPTGWKQKKYKKIEGGWLYNRCHLIGYQLTGQNDNPKNLMTGTREFNSEGMLPFENFVAHYIETTENHVRYRVTPVFEGNQLVAKGVIMEGFSIEDNGKGVQFNLYVPNRQKGIVIDYQTGASREEKSG